MNCAITLGFILCFAFSATLSAETLYFTEEPKSIPGNYTVYSYDTESQKTTAITTNLETVDSVYSFVSGAASCGSKYYASVNNMGFDWGIGVFDTVTGKSRIFGVADLGNEYIFHAIYCSGTDDKTVIAVKGTTSNPEFSVWSVTVSDDMQNIDQKKIGDYGTEGDHYWAAQDNMFASTFAATKEVYTAFTNKNSNSGTIKSMDMKGNVKSHEIVGTPGYPYTTVPLSADSTEYLGLVNAGGHTKTATFVVSGNSITLKNRKDRQDLYTGGKPWQYSAKSNKIYAVDSGQDCSLYVIDAKTLELEDKVSMKTIFGRSTGTIGALAVAN